MMMMLLLHKAVASHVELRTRCMWGYGCMVGLAAATVVAQGGVGDGKAVQLACKRRVTENKRLTT